MTGKRINIPAILMVMAILAIIAFQAYWMYKNYKEEEKTLQIRTAAIFRNVAYKLQAENLEGDTSFRVWNTVTPAVPGERTGERPHGENARLTDPSGKTYRPVPGKAAIPQHSPRERIFIRAMVPHVDTQPFLRKTKPLDSLRKEQIRSVKNDTGFAITVGHKAEMAMKLIPDGKLEGRINTISIQTIAPDQAVTGVTKRIRPSRVTLKTEGKDTLYEYILLSRLMEDGQFQNLIQRVDEAKDTVSLDELGKRFRDALNKESMTLSFTIEKDSTSMYPPHETIDPTRSSELAMGYSSVYFLRYQLLNTFQYITRKLSPQIGLSLLLIALTSFTFALLYRNMMKQRRLTQFKNDLISNITHELKTPIATVSVAIEALKNFHAMNDPRRTEEYLDISNSELQRLSLLVDKVLRLSMFEKHQVELKMERFDLRQLTEEVMASMRLQFEKAGASVQLQAYDTDLSVEADRLHITSVIFNLLDNALKYSKANPSITVNITRNEQGLRLAVSDNGIGIPAAYKKKVFDQFFRVPSGNTHNVKGYGLGLSYVAYVVERHKGKIEIISEPGEGSSFIIQLPDPL